MDPKARQAFDSMMNSMGMGTGKIIKEADQKIDYNATPKKAIGSVGLIPKKTQKQ